MHRDLQALAHLGINPADLDPAPDVPLRHSGYRARIDPGSTARRPCSSCGQPAVATQVLDVPGLGLRWRDSCRTCMLAGYRVAGS